MYYRLNNDILMDYADHKYVDECLETDIITQAELDAHPNKVIVQNGVLVLNPNYEAEQQAAEEAEFNKQFFNTSLGYVRRKVTMKDGNTRDFLVDILPMLTVGVPILTYTRELEQSKVNATEQFINECKQQLFNDFYGEE